MLDFEKIAKSIHRNANGIQDPRIMHTSRDWLIAILIFLSLNILGGVYLWSIHHSYYASTEMSELAIEVEISYQAEMVERALQIVTEKQTAFELFVNSQSSSSPNTVSNVFPEEIEVNEVNEEEEDEEVESVVLFEEA